MSGPRCWRGGGKGGFHCHVHFVEPIAGGVLQGQGRNFPQPRGALGDLSAWISIGSGCGYSANSLTV